METGHCKLSHHLYLKILQTENYPSQNLDTCKEETYMSAAAQHLSGKGLGQNLRSLHEKLCSESENQRYTVRRSEPVTE